eukprot:103627-Alexandrium_andersonii.AAC.1
MPTSPPHRPSPGCHTKDSHTQPKAALVPVAAPTQGGIARVPDGGECHKPGGLPAGGEAQGLRADTC